MGREERISPAQANESLTEYWDYVEETGIYEFEKVSCASGMKANLN